MQEAGQACGEAASDLIGWHEFLVATRVTKDAKALIVAHIGVLSKKISEKVDIDQLNAGARLVNGGSVIAAPLRDATHVQV